MNPADDQVFDLPSGVADLRPVPLAEVRASIEGEFGAVLQRIIPVSAARRVPIAAFNSSI
jgi:FXSXX-COOH protein